MHSSQFTKFIVNNRRPFIPNIRLFRRKLRNRGLFAFIPNFIPATATYYQRYILNLRVKMSFGKLHTFKIITNINWYENNNHCTITATAILAF